eukprot:TRINITY_DN8522_c0_g1_i1.p2 TRINITY_DN8522_c0_g1~~TRINITY_DN8522_c0_g1_i1.p2  ORF type:complete len:524 (+),score=167.50 TRINITY_DN8522_c0_g1_i1:64-1635(+)
MFFFFFSSRRRHTRSCLVSWARRCVQETGISAHTQYTDSLSSDQLQRENREEKASRNPMRYNQIFLVLAICLASSQAFSFSEFFGFFGFNELKVSEVGFQQKWFDFQKVDHFNVTDTRIFSQRYWETNRFYDVVNGPVILYICGEYTCPSIPEQRTFALQLARYFKAKILVLEHRYYGASQPFGDQDLTTDRLKYLTVQNALEDLANFINWVKQNPQVFNVPTTAKWLTIGGSYPGALSAWFRYKYPHLTVGALASSAVVNAITEFPEFDTQIYMSTKKSGDWCPTAIQGLTETAEKAVYKDEATSQAFKKVFKADKMNNEEFLWFFADQFVELVQYGKREFLCKNLKGKSQQDQLNWLAQYVNSLGDENLYQYSAYYLRNTTYDVNNNARQWTYQTCTQVGWLQTAPKDQTISMRSAKIDLKFYKDLCENSFGESLWPDTEALNLELGGAGLQVTNLIMTNGDEDPWKWAGVLKNQGTVLAYVGNCNNCAHCVDLYTPSTSDSWNLMWIRYQIVKQISSWLK